ncbi:hypothetical protein ABPG72_005450 [Tetrahymena utriculariae]
MKCKLLPPSIQRKDQLKQDYFQNLEIQAIRLEKANTQEKNAALQNKIITASIQNQNLKKSSSNLQEVRNSNAEVNYEYTTQIHSKTPQSRDNKIVVKYSKMPSNYELYRQETPPALIPQLNQQKYQVNTNLAQQPAKLYFKKPQNHLTQLAYDEQTTKNQTYQSINTTSKSTNKQQQNNQHQSLKNLQNYNKKPSSSQKRSHNQLELQQNFQLSFEENERVQNETNRKGESRIQNDENGFQNRFIIDGQKLITKKQAPLSAKESFCLQKIPPSNSASNIQNSNFQAKVDSQTKLQALTKQISHIGLSNKQLLPRINANDALINSSNQLNKINNQVNIPIYKQNKLHEKSGIDQFVEQQLINQQNIQLHIQQNTLLQKQLNTQLQSLQNGQSQQQQQNIQPQSYQNNQTQKEQNYCQIQILQKQNQVASGASSNKNKNLQSIQNQLNNNEQLSPNNVIKSASEYLSLQPNQVNLSHEFQEIEVQENIRNQQNDEKVNTDYQHEQINTNQNLEMLQKNYQIQVNINGVNSIQEQLKNQQLDAGQIKVEQKKLNTSSENFKQQNQIQIRKQQNSLKSEYLEINQKEQQLNQKRQKKRKDSDQIVNSSGQHSSTSTKNKFNEFSSQISYQNQLESQKQQDDLGNQNKQNKKGLNLESKQNEKLSPTLNLNPQIKLNTNSTLPNQVNQKNSKKITSKNKIPTANEIKETKPKIKQEPLTIQQFELKEDFFRESFDGYNFDAEESLSGTWTGYTIQQYMKNQKQETEQQNRKQSAQKQKKKKNSITNIKQNENCGLEENKNTEEKLGAKNENEKQIKYNSNQQVTNSQNQFILEDIQIQEN